MTEVACELTEGTSALGGINFAIRGETFQTSFYNVSGRGLVAVCDGLEEGYVDMVDIEILEGKADLLELSRSTTLWASILNHPFLGVVK